ncbi:hypothetical protein BCV69DRAFT_297118 [Microstroma glucosiphilum]|uniref:Uncharacterized protein n=1 Tax=Pseudomicrostroma glucosiphilum TaxID=1684307 RepID=A0A316UD93_9BASI|nr:hypothetical protein BCV69DRAFT_297118 [Pseudomicrostroma glucosiphilum]PWN23169.1 hypothetical protein BCV69DRAFT_297118 [Pseudomicrostroma glucosiphilum]
MTARKASKTRLLLCLAPCITKRDYEEWCEDEIMDSDYEDEEKEELNKNFSATIKEAATEDADRGQMILDLAIALGFSRRLDWVTKCELTSTLWNEVHAVDLASLVVGWMSDATVAYLLGTGSIDKVEAAKTHQAAGIYALVQSFDSQREGVYIGKSDSNRQSCPDTAAERRKPLSATSVRAIFVSLIEAAFIALRGTYRRSAEYSSDAHAVFGTSVGTVPLNGTPGTKTRQHVQWHSSGAPLDIDRQWKSCEAISQMSSKARREVCLGSR